MKPNDPNTNLILSIDPISNVSNASTTNSNHETVVIMTSNPQGHTPIKGSDYIIIDQKGGPNIIVERQQVHNSLANENQNRYSRQQTSDSTVNLASPATEALDYILEDTKPNIHTNLELSNSTMDDNSLLLDLNELLKRDPTFSVLEDSKPISPTQFISTSSNNVEVMNAANININNRQGLAIPGSRQNTNMFPTATIISSQAGNMSGSILQNRLNLEAGGSIESSVGSSEKTAFDHGSLGSPSPSFFPSQQGGGIILSPSQPNNASNAIPFNMINKIPSDNLSHGPTLAQLNSPTENEIPTGLMTAENGIKMEINDFDVIDDLDLFLSSQSANVSLGMANQDIKPNMNQLNKQPTNILPLSPLSQQIKQEPGTSGVNIISGNPRNIQATNVTPLTNMNFWQPSTDDMIFGASSIPRHPSDSSNTTIGSSSAANSTIASLSSSVPVNIFHNVTSPLSDILTELSPGPSNVQNNSNISVSGVSPSMRSTISPNGFIVGSTIANTLLSPNAQTQSNAGPVGRNSTLHKLLMQRKGDGPITGRPSPVRSPEARKTLEQMKNSLSTSNPLISQQLLSRSAPTSNPLGPGSSQMENRMWARREPRQHISSVCSVGEASSIADEVNDVLSGLSPNDDLHDIPSDDEDDLTGNYAEYKESSDDDSDFEGTSMERLSTSAGSSGGGTSGNKKERHFWQYNVQAKGPKGQKIVIDTKMEDPHQLNDIVDPVFSGDVQLQGIKHSGKARRGDGNDLTANPRKLAAIGKELEQLSRVINDMTPVSEMPFGARCKSRKEKNKLASRACRLKKKAQHEANKLKCDGLLKEHRELANSLDHVKNILLMKMEPNTTQSQSELTAELDRTVKKSMEINIAGNTTNFVNKMIEKNLPYV